MLTETLFFHLLALVERVNVVLNVALDFTHQQLLFAPEMHVL